MYWFLGRQLSKQTRKETEIWCQYAFKSEQNWELFKRHDSVNGVFEWNTILLYLLKVGRRKGTFMAVGCLIDKLLSHMSWWNHRNASRDIAMGYVPELKLASSPLPECTNTLTLYRHILYLVLPFSLIVGHNVMHSPPHTQIAGFVIDPNRCITCQQYVGM